MQSSAAPPVTSHPRERGPLRLDSGSEWNLLLLVGAGIVVLVLAAAILPTVSDRAFRATAGEAALFAATLAAGVVLIALGRQSTSWAGTRWAAAGLVLAWAFQLAGWIERLVDGRPPAGELAAGSLSILLILLLGGLVIDFFDHIKTGRAELLSDVGLVATLFGAAVYLMQQGQGPSSEPLLGSILTAVMAASAIVLVAGWGVLVLWCPTAVHMGIFGSVTLMSVSAIALGHARQFDWDPGSLVGPEVVAGISMLLLAGVLVIEPRLNGATPRPPHGYGWVRPALLALALGAAAAMVVAELISIRPRLSVGQNVVLAAVVFGSVGGRMLLNHLEMSRVTRAMAQALAERESAIASLRVASKAIASSEARHRLLVDSAVDGIVELDASGVIVRANDAFCRTVRLSVDEVVGQSWVDAARAAGMGESLERLPQSGEATLEREGVAAYLEARSSMLPTMPSGKLLLIRDVTASKTAEQTIRTLFHYLQDRDEDRSRLIARSNSAIEAERNRIARDLHDGPIQGVSAAALSLEAARMLVERGRTVEAEEMLRDIGTELGQEAVNLRRIMSDLRPPVLEERGLIPAVRDLCARLRRELRIPVSVMGAPGTEIARDIEMLAYRIVQEALSNVGKHAAASQVTVRIAGTAGTLQVEVSDDGRGFDVRDVREFLRSGKVGLASMRERTELSGGTFSVRSSPGAGTTISATIPFEVLDSAAGIPRPATARSR